MSVVISIEFVAVVSAVVAGVSGRSRRTRKASDDIESPKLGAVQGFIRRRAKSDDTPDSDDLDHETDLDLD